MNQARFDDCLERADIVQMLTDTRVCLNCGKRLPRGHEFKRKTGYCNQFCYFEKPPKMAFLEHQYGKSAKDVIIETLNRTNNVTLSAELLGVSKFTIFQWIKKLNIKRHVEWRYESEDK